QSADRHCHPTILLAMIVHRADLPDLPTDCNQFVKGRLIDEVSGVMLAVPRQVWAKRIRSDRCALNKTKYLVHIAEYWFGEPAQACDELLNGYFLRRNWAPHVPRPRVCAQAISRTRQSPQ